MPRLTLHPRTGSSSPRWNEELSLKSAVLLENFGKRQYFARGQDPQAD